MVRASASQSVNLEFIFQVELYQKTVKIVFTACLLGVQHKRDSVENKPASLLVVPLAKKLNGMLPSLCDRQVAPRTGSTRVVLRRQVKIDSNLENIPYDTTTRV